MVTSGAPHYNAPLQMAPEDARRALSEHMMLALNVARAALGKVKPSGTLIFMGAQARDGHISVSPSRRP